MNIPKSQRSSNKFRNIIASVVLALYTQQSIGEIIECRTSYDSKNHEALQCTHINDNGNMRDYWISKSEKIRIGKCILDIRNKTVASLSCKRGKSGSFPELQIQ